MRNSDKATANRRTAGAMRLLPIVMIAGVFLFVLKGADLMFNSGQFVGAISPAHGQEAKPEKASKDIKDAEGKKAEAGAPADGEKVAKKAPEKPKDVMDDPRRFLSNSERAVLESLAKRRKAIDARERNLKLQENLLKATEKRIESRIAALKKIEKSINEQFNKEEKRTAKNLKDLVSLYENMKPADAARIFNRLEMGVLVSLAEQIKPRKMAGVLAKMNSESAERLTLELAARASGTKPGSSAKLPRLKDANPG